VSEFQIQRSGHTAPDRYPNLFRATRDLSSALGCSAPRILSFGCSTGEEASTLALNYFQESNVVGLDINLNSIELAKSNHSVANRTTFACSSPDTVAEYGPYSVIFALGVLCRWPESAKLDDISNLFPFREFEQMVGILDNSLVTGGILVLNGTNYNFLDTVISDRYDVALAPAIMNNGAVDRFDRYGRRCVGHDGSDSIFVKREKNVSRLTSNVRNRRIMDLNGHIIGTLATGDY
jgi:SAM-dependent methyltransferase